MLPVISAYQFTHLATIHNGRLVYYRFLHIAWYLKKITKKITAYNLVKMVVA